MGNEAETGQVSEAEALAHADPGSPEFQLDYYPFYLLNRTAARYNSLMEAALRPMGADVATWRVLMILSETSPRNAGDIAEKAAIPISTMTRIIQRMQKDGLVRCNVAAGDKRVNEVHLSKAGTVALAAIRPAASRVFAMATKGLQRTELDLLKTLLDGLYANLGEPRAAKTSAPAATRKMLDSENILNIEYS